MIFIFQEHNFFLALCNLLAILCSQINCHSDVEKRPLCVPLVSMHMYWLLSWLIWLSYWPETKVNKRETCVQFKSEKIAHFRLQNIWPIHPIQLACNNFFVSWRLQELVLHIYRNIFSVAIREDCFVNRIAGHISLAFYFLEVPSVQHLPGNAYSLWFQNILSAILFIWEQDWCKTMVPTWLCLIASCTF